MIINNEREYFMDDWIFKHFKWLVTAGIAFCCLLIWGMIEINQEGSEKRKDLMEECMKDHKEYECYAMLRGGSNFKPIPIIMPMHSR